MPKTNEEGRWLLVCKKENTLRVICFVNHTLLSIFSEHITEDARMIGFDYLIRPHESGNKTIGSYADALKKSYTPQSSYLQNTYNKRFDHTPICRPKKRIMVNTEDHKECNAAGALTTVPNNMN
eukprot:15342462-Ditylum_brightwellii.AAC.1